MNRLFLLSYLLFLVTGAFAQGISYKSEKEILLYPPIE